MHRTLRSAFRLLLAILSALSSIVQQQAEARLLRTYDCTSWDTCRVQPHSFTLRTATVALAAPPGRLEIVTLRLVHRSGWNADARAGVDLLFSARNELLLARARASLDEQLDLTLSIHAATQGIAASPSRAPPALS
jgi:hypothetical protein